MASGVRFRYGWEYSEQLTSRVYEITDVGDALDPRPYAPLPCAGHGRERGELRGETERSDGGPPGPREAARHGGGMVRLGRRGAHAFRDACLRLDCEQPQSGALPRAGGGGARGWARSEAGRRAVYRGAGLEHSGGPDLSVAGPRRRARERVWRAAGSDRAGGADGRGEAPPHKNVVQLAFVFEFAQLRGASAAADCVVRVWQRTLPGLPELGAALVGPASGDGPQPLRLGVRVRRGRRGGSPRGLGERVRAVRRGAFGGVSAQKNERAAVLWFWERYRCPACRGFNLLSLEAPG